MVNKLIEIAQYIKADDLQEKLYELSENDKDSCPLTLPLVGEFSAGKTTLINALTDSKQLEIAFKPTTSTIYQIHFNSDEIFAQVYKEDGSIENVDDISSLKNDNLSGTETVLIFDTSTKVPENIVLVDTPGLSSAEAKHKQALMGFLPQADGILLTIDINQQITRSLTEFIEDMEFAKRRVYLVITKCDTKPASEIEKIKNYICKTTKLPIEQIICVSPKEDKLDELYSLLEDINKDKAKILKEINEQRVIKIAKILSSRIDELLNVQFSSASDFDSIKKNHEFELKKLKRNIDKLINDIYQDVDFIKNDISKNYKERILRNINTLIANTKSGNHDNEVRNTINSVTELYLNEYKNEIQNILYQKVSERKNTEDDIRLDSLLELDMTSLKPDDIYYNLNLGMAGHEYDATISKAAKIAMNIASIIPGVINLGRVAIGGAVAAAKATAQTFGRKVATRTLINTVATGGIQTILKRKTWNTAIKAGEIAGTKVLFEEAVKNISQNKEIVDGIHDLKGKYITSQRKLEMLERRFENNPILALPNNSENNEDSNGFCPKRSFTEMLISKITDKFAGPERQRVINDYLNDEVIPWFKRNLERMEKELIEMISENLKNEADFVIEQKNNSLNEEKSKYEADKEGFEKRLNSLREYKKDLDLISCAN